MFIKKIYEALQSGRNVLLVGPVSCGKSTVLVGVLTKMHHEIVNLHMSDVRGMGEWPEKYAGSVVCIEGTPTPLVCTIVKNMSTVDGGPQFVFHTSDGDIPEHIYEGRRIDIIGWPESECPP